MKKSHSISIIVIVALAAFCFGSLTRVSLAKLGVRLRNLWIKFNFFSNLTKSIPALSEVAIGKVKLKKMNNYKTLFFVGERGRFVKLTLVDFLDFEKV